MATEQEIKKSLTRLMDAFTIYNKDPESIRAFTRIVIEKLSGFPLFILARAVEQIIDTQTWMPKIAEMIAACVKANNDEYSRLYNIRLDYQQDYDHNKLHTREEWMQLKGGYQRMNDKKGAAYIDELYGKYKELPKPFTPEQKAQMASQAKAVREMLGALGGKMGMK